VGETILGAIRDFVGGRSVAYEQERTKARKIAFSKWKTKLSYIEKPCLLKAIKELQSGIFFVSGLWATT